MVDTLDMPTGLRPPHRLAQLGELTLPFDLMRFGLQWPRLVTAPRGDGRPVYLIPGYGGSELSMRPLEAFLRRINYDVADWSLGRNKGSVDRDVARFSAVAEERFAANGEQAFTLIGWSLGGIIARETARLSPHLVREVITMGTPIIGGPKYTTPGQRYAKANDLRLDQFEREVHQRNSIGFDQPLTVLYSNRDGIVGPDIAKDIYNSQARNIRVDGGHMGLGFNPRVWRIIADTLAGRT
ncbi:alpha/beta hydrolase [uncultured Parasphingorhabdus sp.]|uniref:esterase/lipase family protein n=1 Tax=uncultured Parasphingorhabdus sp. TaxID=2709694 RepID=UPI002AA6938F|nr:alpha/beta hydrolase [uncultured Parasphingorhabdus sp.]